MHFRRYSADAFELCDIHPLFMELLADLPHVAARHKKARARLYPDPFGEDASGEDHSDWDEHVRPELERHFTGTRERVAADLAALGSGARAACCLIPAGNIDAWLNALNQARLVIVEENGFGEAALSGAGPPDLLTQRGLALLKVHFYAHLQELLIEAAG